MFLALGRLAEYKRIDLLLRLWERVRHVVGGRLVIAGDGPDRARIEALAGPDVVIVGRVSEQEKHRLLCSAWVLLHPALIEGWGIVIAEAAIRGTPAIGFDVPGVRDSVVDGETGVLVRSEGQFASAWASLALDHRTRQTLGRAARERALRLHWSAAVEGFAQVADEAVARAGSRQRQWPGTSGACGARDAGGDNGRGAWGAAGVLREPGRAGQLGAGPRGTHGPHACPGTERRAWPGLHSRRGMR
jgi:glycogen synthase